MGVIVTIILDADGVSNDDDDDDMMMTIVIRIFTCGRLVSRLLRQYHINYCTCSSSVVNSHYHKMYINVIKENLEPA